MNKNFKAGRQITLAALAAATVAASPFIAASAAHAVADDAYLQDYDNTAGQIDPSVGNTSSLANGHCAVNWQLQSVIDLDLDHYSNNGFLQTVGPLAEPTLPGSGYGSLQHFYLGSIANDTVQLFWRIPIAVEGEVIDASANLVFDDEDWTVDQTSFEQYSPFAGFESAFARFTGIAGFEPHDDAQMSTPIWGSSGGYTTLSFGLGDIQPYTSTVFQFTGTPNATPGATGSENLQNGVAYGAKLTVSGRSPLASCHLPSYAESAVEAGSSVTVLPTFVGTQGEAITVAAGTVFSLDSTAAPGLVIDPATGALTWNVPAAEPVGTVDVPVVITYPDHDEFSTGSVDHATARINVTAQAAAAPEHPDSPEQHDELAATGSESASQALAVGALSTGLGALLMTLRRSTTSQKE
ncbi:MAG: hypothetical protein GX862_03175 [Leucobacter sp.]|nr:hypothetical protein [Leucobacter sp.]